jgi:hypothetical protein
MLVSLTDVFAGESIGGQTPGGVISCTQSGDARKGNFGLVSLVIRLPVGK